jgi:uncharacterized protein YggT (Ycf19 family)
MSGIRIILVRILNAIALIIGVFLALRVIFAFFSANPSAPFVSWIYSVSSFLTYPFSGIFSNIQVPSTGGFIDVSAFISLLAYGVIVSLLIAVVNTIFHPVAIGRDTHQAHIH